MDPRGTRASGREGDPSPEGILRIGTGAWGASVLATAIQAGLFDHVANGADTIDSLARAAALSPRGATGLLDALTGLGLLERAEGRWRCSPEAERFLRRGRPEYMGDFIVLEGFESLPDWQRLPAAARTGEPARAEANAPDAAFFEKLVPAILPLAVPAARAAAAALRVADAGPLEVLDVGGGSGAWALVWLQANRQATFTQLDLAPVNAIARRIVAERGVAERFRTWDADFLATELGDERFDAIVCAHIAHMLAPRDNAALLRRAWRALRPGGHLVIADFVLDDDRRGHPFALLFAANMLMHTREGACWREGDYRSWLAEAGFGPVRREETGGPVTLIVALRS